MTLLCAVCWSCEVLQREMGGIQTSRDPVQCCCLQALVIP